jgi:2,3-bisphosphoglycerate-dependent phosphoglycerate mutase
MTTVYFIRHAEPARSADSHKAGVKDAEYPLSEKGKADCSLVTHFLRDKKIDAVLSSPFKRAVDTVAPFTREAGLDITIINDFRERRITYENVWIEDFKAYAEAQWADFAYKLEDGESLGEVQARKMAALHEVLRRYAGKTVVIGTHGTALSLVLHDADPAYGITDFMDMAGRMPYAVKMVFDESTLKCVEIEKTDLFVYEKPITVFYPVNSFAVYGYTVVFARVAVEGKQQWLFARHCERTTWDIPGGRVEPGETALECAKRELYEETGAAAVHIRPVFDFTAHFPNAPRDSIKAGQVFLAEVTAFGDIPEGSEMAEARAFPGLPGDGGPGFMTYPQAHVLLYEEMQRWLAE